MSPGKVGKEFFMTRGHIHAIVDRPELYFGLKGYGLMLMESPDDKTRTVEIRPNTACYVPPYWIHRSMNLGDKDFVMLFCYPADSGQDYAIIERSQGMRLRIVDDGSGGWCSVPNADYQARSPEAGRGKDIKIFAAADGQKEALEAIKQEGAYMATGKNDPVEVATKSVEIAVKAAKGEIPQNFPKTTLTEPAAITRGNVEQFQKPDAVF
jgi:mannose-6-phosphate isomerase-like protein (cupin superfamily)